MVPLPVTALALVASTEPCQHSPAAALSLCALHRSHVHVLDREIRLPDDVVPLEVGNRCGRPGLPDGRRTARHKHPKGSW